MNEVLTVSFLYDLNHFKYKFFYPRIILKSKQSIRKCLSINSRILGMVTVAPLKQLLELPGRISPWTIRSPRSINRKVLYRTGKLKLLRSRYRLSSSLPCNSNNLHNKTRYFTNYKIHIFKILRHTYLKYADRFQVRLVLQMWSLPNFGICSIWIRINSQVSISLDQTKVNLFLSNKNHTYHSISNLLRLR